jgi:hypothetical protein
MLNINLNKYFSIKYFAGLNITSIFALAIRKSTITDCENKNFHRMARSSIG